MMDRSQDAPVRRALTLAAILLVTTPLLAAGPPAGWDEPGPVPAVPLATDIGSLTLIPLRREIARAEGRISDLEKSRAAELEGLAAAADAARAQAGTTATGATTEVTHPGGSDATNPLLNADRRAERQRGIEQRYARALAEARRRLHRLLEHQARIDPEAPDQRRLRDAATADMTRP